MDPSSPYYRLHAPPETPADEICKCRGKRPIKLMSALGYNPIHCLDCNREVRPETFRLTARLSDDIVSWRSVYDAIDRLWLDSGPYEKWAKAELSNIKSEVNHRGLALCRKLNRLRRCYFWYFQDQSVDILEPIKNCACCKKPLREYSKGIFPQLICGTCSIVTVGDSVF
jgi:hypothetical protein